MRNCHTITGPGSTGVDPAVGADARVEVDPDVCDTVDADAGGRAAGVAAP